MVFQSKSPEIKILRVTRVSPPSDSPSSVRTLSLPFTFFDIFWIKFPPVERVFFYELTETQCFDTVVLPKLERSLSVALLHFLPLAGQVRWDPLEPKPSTVYVPGDDVLLTVAECKADMTRLSCDEIHEATELRTLIPEFPVSDHSATTISLQITLFPNQGFSLAIVAHHAVLDGKSATMFLKAWAYICKQELGYDASLPEDLTPFFDRSVIQEPDGADMKLIDFSMRSAGGVSDPKKRTLQLIPELGGDSDSVRATVQLCREHINKLRQKVLEKQLRGIHNSSFVLMYAYVISCMVKARAEGKTEQFGFGFSADCRARLDPPAPQNYFGNCVSGGCRAAKTNDLISESGVVHVVETLNEMIAELTREYIYDPMAAIDSFTQFEPGTPIVSIAGSNRFGVYDVDFGWGKPKKVEIASIDRTGAISLAESRDGNGGVEIGVCLKKHEAEAFVTLFEDGLKNL